MMFNQYGMNYISLYYKPVGEALIYESDFTVGVDGFTANGGAVAGNIDAIAGVDDTLRFTDSLTLGAHRANRIATLTAGLNYRIEFDYYIPSTNGKIDQIRAWTGNGADATKDVTVLDAWTSDSLIVNSVVGTSLVFSALDGGVISFTGVGTDVFYLKNIFVYHDF